MSRSSPFDEQGPALSIEQVAAIAAGLAAPVAENETLPLVQADRRVLACDVAAPLSLPPFANAAVDGYAVRFADLAASGETLLPLAGRVIAGADAAELPAAGLAVRVFTGAPLPPGADTVFMQEDVALEAGRVRLPAGARPGANLRPAGESIERGAPALPAGRLLRPQDIALLAALGIAEVPVRRRVRVALFSTGNELNEPGAGLPPAGIYDSNRAGLRALVARTGATVSDLGILRDEPESLARHLAAAAASHDLILTSGGVSGGDEDHVSAAVARIGEIASWRLAIKPGRPLAMGRIGAVPFIGLPGNPVAVFVTFALIARPLIALLSGSLPTPLRGLPVRLGFSQSRKPGRREYLRVSLSEGADGVPVAMPHAQQGSASLLSLAQTDGLLELAEGRGDLFEGEIAPFLSYEALTG